MQKTSAICAAVLLALGITSSAEAAWYTSTGNNLTVLGGTGGIIGGTNDVTFGWDGTLRTAVVTDGSSNASLSSPTLYYSKAWTVHHMNIYAPGSYVFYTGCSAGDPSCGVGSQYNLTVPTGYLGAHMLWDWSITHNTGAADPFCAGAAGTAGCNTTLTANDRYTVWSMVSVDTPFDTDTYHGTKMIDGPTVGLSWNFNVMTSAVPVPAAAWLFGSGLLGLVGVTARRKAS